LKALLTNQGSFFIARTATADLPAWRQDALLNNLLVSGVAEKTFLT
jgi:hypothetical protein